MILLSFMDWYCGLLLVEHIEWDVAHRSNAVNDDQNL